MARFKTLIWWKIMNTKEYVLPVKGRKIWRLLLPGVPFLKDVFCWFLLTVMARFKTLIWLKIMNTKEYVLPVRVEICHDQRSGKICASSINFPQKKQYDFWHNLRRTTTFIHTKCDFALKLSKFYTLSSSKKNY